MADAGWERVDELYHGALARDPSERAAFLRLACGDDEELRREVESLLAEEPDERFLASHALEHVAIDLTSAPKVRIGQQIGAYRILSLLGAGGMGEVYRARDAKLGRDVAIKMLPPVFAHEPDRVGRFAREARLLASLNHPHIAAIHGVEEAAGVSALVLELVEGETLADRIARGPLPLAEAVSIARQITDGLEAAHETGIVHRDLKPSNIKVRPDGHVKILDFGLAKALAPSPEDSPHATTLSRVGVVAGTPAYMSPEQARGEAVDKRADVWAFGCVFYEMLTGSPAFAGGTVSATLAAVMTSEPAWESLPRELSPGLRAFLRRCLAKDVRQRVSDIRDMRLALEGAFESDVAVPPAPERRRRLPTAATTALVVGLVAIGAGAGWLSTRAPRPAPLVSRLSIEVPLFSVANVAPVLTVSPDGTQIVYASDGALWLRRLDSLQPTVLPGTENSNAHTPVFSPNGRWLAFYDPSARALKRMAVGGGSPIVIAAVERPFGMAWPDDETLLYGRGADGIWRLRLSNGAPEQIVTVSAGEEAHSPQLLPDKRILFTVKPRGLSSWEDGRIVAQSPGSDTPTVLIERGRNARYLRSGHLVYASGTEVRATSFDGDTGRLRGEPVTVVTDVRRAYVPYADHSHFSASDNGTLAYSPPPAAETRRRTLVWVTRDGVEEPLNLSVAGGNRVLVSPDGRRIVRSGEELLASDTVRLAWLPVISQRGSWGPIWSHDSSSVVLIALEEGTYTFMRVRIDGTGRIERRPISPVAGGGQPFSLKGNQLVSAGALTRDGRRLVFTVGNQIHARFGVLELNDGGTAPLQWKIIDRVYDMSGASLSPDDRWIAYQSQQSGIYHAYIDRFPDMNDPKQISGEGGGSNPVWSADGREVFFRRSDGAMMAVPVTTTPTLKIGNAAMLFESEGYGTGPRLAGGGGRLWDVAPDGRFLMPKEISPRLVSDRIVVVQNWSEELNRLVSAP